MLDYRSWGATKNCHGCRYWSEMLAREDGAGVVAMCLARGQTATNAGKWTTKNETCGAWAEGSDGAIDEPGSDPLRYKTSTAANYK